LRKLKVIKMNWEDTIRKYSAEPLNKYGEYSHSDKRIMLIAIQDDLENLKRILKFIDGKQENNQLLEMVRNPDRGLPFVIKAIEKMVSSIGMKGD